jgi:hypothetical protein
MQLQDLTGQQFGRLVVLKRETLDKVGTYWKCQCECGKTTVVFGASLKRGLTTSCGCRKRGIGEIFKKRPYESLYRVLVRSAKTSLSHTLTYEEFVEFTSIGECHYCGTPVGWAKHNVAYRRSRYNLDRKDNNVGYTKANCVVCCKRCNRSKSDAFTYEQWLLIGQLMRNNPDVFREAQ